MREIILAATITLGILIFAYIEKIDYIPKHVKSFCQAKQDVYGDPYDECISQYLKHKK